ncbi:MAG TPA: phosphotransferase [Nocardioidaceae bacterium]|nr:phosphotransferase [Nocardioidaceae bacterium]
MPPPPDLADAAIPHGQTARRLEWPLLPPYLRRAIEERLGSPVVDAHSAGAGYTPGFASTLTVRDGQRQFVKAASVRAQRPFADAYRIEIRRLRELADTGVRLPVPRLLWAHEDGSWVVLGLEYVEGGNPARPWRRDELDQCLDTLEVLAEAVTPSPLSVPSFAEDVADMLPCWEHVRAVAPEWPHLDEAVALAARIADATRGETLVHTDARDDNFLLAASGPVLCDWNWTTQGAAWIDTVCLLIAAHGDGVDADEIVASRRLTCDVPPDDIDTVLSLLAGYFLERRDQPAPNSSPYLRVHQSWYAEATWGWLAKRRGWS